MQTTFQYRPVSREPRYRLQPGVTAHRSAYSRRRHRSKVTPPPPPQPEPDPLSAVPASARDFALETLKFPADPKQQEVLATTNGRVIVCCTRQWGKSTTGAIKALHHAATNPASLVLLASRTRRQTGELLEKVISFARILDIPIRRAPRHPDSLLLPNQSRIIALPGNSESLRGFSAVSLLIIDEAAFVPDDLYFALRPMLATTNGAIWLLSTPRGRRGVFYDEWTSQGDTWAKFSVTALDCPRISAQFLDEERRLHGPAFYKREYLCDFGDSGHSCFEIDALDAASDEGHFIAGQQFALGRPRSRFYVGFDLGQRSSHSAVVVLERVSGPTDRRDPVTFEWITETRLFFRLIERFPLNVTYDSIAMRLNRIVRDLGDLRDITLIVDATGCGQPFAETLRKHKLGCLILAVGITSGVTGSYSNNIERVPKKTLLAAANFVLMSRALTAWKGMAGLAELREEMEAYRVHTSRAGSDSFRTSQKDDLVMAFALAAWKARQFLPIDKTLPAGETG